jgi:hypothetical protein
LPNLGYCKIASGFDDFAGLVIYDPIANAGFGATEVLARKLITLGGAVVVNLIRAVDENAESHFSSLALPSG